jgi:hypothetical protein
MLNYIYTYNGEAQAQSSLPRFPHLPMHKLDYSQVSNLEQKE